MMRDIIIVKGKWTMRRSAAMMMLAALLVFSPVMQAQYRGGHSGFPGRMAPRFPHGISWGIQGPMSHYPSLGFGLSRSALFFPQPFDYYRHAPVPWAIYLTPSYPDPVSAPAPAPASNAAQSEIELAYQVGRLTQEVEQLRQEQALHASQQAAQAQAIQAQALAAQNLPEATSNPRVLVFRDGHHREFRNYAIVGETLWILDGKGSAKISVAELDVPATQKENSKRGVRCPLP
jgi:hypothetical protein